MLFRYIKVNTKINRQSVASGCCQGGKMWKAKWQIFKIILDYMCNTSYALYDDV